jgi:hypothetical protein
MPAFHFHLTIAAVEHHPQCIEENIDVFFKLMTDLGGSWTILYNGPECGASAPDHFHFQAIPAGLLPIEKAYAEEHRLSEITRSGGVVVYRIQNIAREALMLKADDPSALAKVFRGTISALKQSLHLNREPMMSIAGIGDGKKQRVFMFPRAKHRPEAFFKEGAERIAVSPAVIEMCGVIVTPAERDFKRLDAHDIENIYREVSLKTDMGNLTL